MYNKQQIEKFINLCNKLTKEEIIKNTIEKNGFFINTDGISYDLNGKGMAEYLMSLGFGIIKYYDAGTHGIVLTREGIEVSTNGYCSMF